MRGPDIHQDMLFSTVSPESRVPKDHPLRPVRQMVDAALKSLHAEFEALYSAFGRESIPPEKLLRAQLLMALYTIRSERQLMEQIDYNLLSKEHFSVDGTMIEALASLKSYRPKDEDEPPGGEGGGRNRWVDFKGEKRSRDTHESKTDKDALLYKKNPGTGAKLCYLGHLLMENRHGLVVDAQVTQATGTAEREAAVDMVSALSDTHRVTLGADKNYDTQGCVDDLRCANATPHVAQNTSNRSSAIDGRTTCHEGYAVSQRIRKRMEECFGWAKTIGGLRKSRFVGRERLDFQFLMTFAAYNLVRMRNLGVGACC